MHYYEVSPLLIIKFFKPFLFFKLFQSQDFVYLVTSQIKKRLMCNAFFIQTCSCQIRGYRRIKPSFKRLKRNSVVKNFIHLLFFLLLILANNMHNIFFSPIEHTDRIIFFTKRIKKQTFSDKSQISFLFAICRESP